ncbi:MAG: TetR/AcrR family transcriptional regulator C-terminal domain-containing protein [Clostridia bacterium]|nr:TetR/AcrR family transcriptional regulator C-terminal domain-containing protein [Clostridia bacterium]
MANFTKDAIKASFRRLLEEQPLNRITVKAVAEECGINRNSFYYHFQDMPALVEELIRDDCDSILADYPSIDSMEQCLTVAVDFARRHRRTALHIYNSINRDLYEHYLWHICEYVVTSYFSKTFSETELATEDREILIHYYKCLCFGQLSDWMRGGMRDDPCASFHRLCLLRKRQFEAHFGGDREADGPGACADQKK